MQIRILAIGRFRNEPIKQVYDNFIRRLPWPCELKEIQSSKDFPISQLKSREASLLIDSIPKKSFSIALDERGQMLTSEAFAKKIGGLRDEGLQDITFLIGGADGHGKAIYKKADLVLSLGPMIWPHLFVRAMLAEQLWRTSSILSGHPYHRT